MPDAPQTATPATAPAAQAGTQSPADKPALSQNGVPLTLGASIDELLAPPPPPSAASVPAAPAAPAAPDQDTQAAGDGSAAAGENKAEVAPDSDESAELADPDEQSAVADAQSALADAVAAVPAQPAFDEERAIRELTEQKLGLLRVQGAKNKELGDLRAEVRRLTEIIEQQALARTVPAEAALPPDEELAARLLDKPSQYLLTPAQVKELARQEAEALIQSQAAAWQEQQAYEQSAVAPAVGVDLFLARHGIKQDWPTWIQSDEGKAVDNLFTRDETRQRLLQAYRDDADPRGIADTLTRALEAHRLGKKAAQGRHAVNGEKARIAAARPASTPVRPATPPPAVIPQAKSIFAKDFTDADLMDFMRGAEPYEQE